MQRKGTWLAAASGFSMVGSSVCITLSAEDVLELEISQRHNEMEKKRRVFFHNYTFHLSSAGLNAPCWAVMHAKHLFFLMDVTPLLIRWPRADMRLGCIALIDFWLSSMPLYLFQSWPFTFTALLIIYRDMFSVNVHKSAVLDSPGSRWTASNSTWRVTWWSKPEILLGSERTVRTQLI